jgi:hypothetical protein
MKPTTTGTKYTEDSLTASGFRRDGNYFTKDIVTGSTITTPVIREMRKIQEYQDMLYETPDLETASGIRNYGLVYDFDAVQAIIAEATQVVEAEEDRVFGTGERLWRAGGGAWKELEEAPDFSQESVREKGWQNKGDGLFGEYVGYAPIYKSGYDLDMSKSRSKNIEHAGSGELGRIMGLLNWYNMEEGAGYSKVNMPSWDKPMWDTFEILPGWEMEAPSFAGAVDLVVQAVATIATAPVGGFGGAVLGAAIGSVDDLMFTALEVGTGYITGEQAALQFFQKGVTAAFSIGFDGLMDGVVGSFKGFGILAEGLENLGKSIIKNNFNSWVNAFELDGKGGWDWNGEAYQESAWGSGALGMYASAFVTPMAQRGATDFFTQDGTGLDLTGNVFGIKNLAALGNTIGGLTGEFASYLFDGDFSVNVLNLSDLTGGALNHGLIEFSLTGQNRFGGGGANVGGFTGILNSLKAIRSDAIYVASHKLGGNQGLAEINATNRLGYAGEEDLAKRLVSGDLKIQWSDLDDAHGKFLQGQEGTIHISTAYANNDAESASKMAAVIGHEATHEQGERIEAYAHLSGSSIYRTLMQRGMATDSDFLNGIMSELMREENYLENSGDADWWKLIVQRDEAGEIIGGRLEDDGKEAFTIIDGEAISIGALQEATGNNWFRFRSLAEALDTTETGLLQGLLFENMTIGGIDFSKENTGFEMSLNQAITQFLMQKANGESNRAAYFIPGQSAFTERSWEEFGRQVVSANMAAIDHLLYTFDSPTSAHTLDKIFTLLNEKEQRFYDNAMAVKGDFAGGDMAGSAHSLFTLLNAERAVDQIWNNEIGMADIGNGTYIPGPWAYAFSRSDDDAKSTFVRLNDGVVKYQAAQRNGAVFFGSMLYRQLGNALNQINELYRTPSNPYSPHSVSQLRLDAGRYDNLNNKVGSLSQFMSREESLRYQQWWRNASTQVTSIGGRANIIDGVVINDLQTGNTFTGSIDISSTIQRVNSGVVLEQYRNDGTVFGYSGPNLPPILVENCRVKVC